MSKDDWTKRLGARAPQGDEKSLTVSGYARESARAGMLNNYGDDTCGGRMASRPNRPTRGRGGFGPGGGK